MRRVHASAAAPANQSTTSLNGVKHEHLSCSGQSVPERLNEQAASQVAPELLSSHFKAGSSLASIFQTEQKRREEMGVLFRLLVKLAFLFFFYLTCVANIFSSKGRLAISEAS